MGGDLTSGGETNSGTPPIREDRNHKQLLEDLRMSKRSFRNSGAMRERFAAACSFLRRNVTKTSISRCCQSTRADLSEGRSEDYLHPLTSIRCANPNPPNGRPVFEFKLYEVFRESRSWTVRRDGVPQFASRVPRRYCLRLARARRPAYGSQRQRAAVSILDSDTRGNLPLGPILLPVIRRRPKGTLPRNPVGEDLPAVS